MATTIKLKNGSGAPLAGDLVAGEPALDLTNKRLYTENSSGTVIEVGTNPGASGAVTLNHSGNAKLATTSTGIDVTGTVTVTGILEASDGTNGEMQFGLGTALTTGAGTYDSSVRWNGSGGNLLFSQGAVEKMRIGALGIDVTGTVTADSATVVTSGGKSTIAIGDQATGTYGQLLLHGGNGKYNFSLGAQFNVNNAFEITPSTTAGGTTFSTPALVVDSSGNVGIGTNLPATALEVKNSAGAQIRASNGSATFDILNDSTNTQLLSSGPMFYRTNGTGEHIFQQSGGASEAMRIKAGNVGIGDTNPSAQLSIYTGSQANTLPIKLTSSRNFQLGDVASVGIFGSGFTDGSHDLGAIRFSTSDDKGDDGGASWTRIYAGGQSSTYASSNLMATFANQGSGSDYIAFATEGTERLTIDGVGNVGIGGIDPQASLHISAINGRTAFQFDANTQTIPAGGFGGAVTYNYTSGQANVNFWNTWETSSSTQGGFDFRKKTGASSSDLLMSINGNGNVGIGTNSNFGKLSINSNGDPATSGNMTTGLTVHNGATGTAINIGTNDGGSYNYIQSAYVNSTGTARNLAFFVGAARAVDIDTSGNLLVGDSASPETTRFLSKGAGNGSSNYSVYFVNSDETELFGVRNDGVVFTGQDGGSPYNLTTATSANVVVESSGALRRSTSSKRYKTDIQTATWTGEQIDALRPVTYKGLNDGDTIFGGLIAEEVHDAGLSEFVSYNESNEPDALHYQQMVALCIKEIQSLRARVAQLEGAN